MFYYIINHTVTAYIQKNQCKKGSRKYDFTNIYYRISKAVFPKLR